MLWQRSYRKCNANDIKCVSDTEHKSQVNIWLYWVWSFNSSYILWFCVVEELLQHFVSRSIADKKKSNDLELVRQKLLVKSMQNL